MESGFLIQAADVDVVLLSNSYSIGVSMPRPEWRLHYYSNVREGKKPHEITGARLARKALARLGYEHETVEHVAKLIEAHMFQDYREPKPVKARRFLARYGDMAHELIEHKRADLGASGRSTSRARTARRRGSRSSPG